jgi:hypothetical protein
VSQLGAQFSYRITDEDAGRIVRSGEDAHARRLEAEDAARGVRSKRGKPEPVERLRYAAEAASPAFTALMSEAAGEVEDLRRGLVITEPFVSGEDGSELEPMQTVDRA